MGNLIYGSWNGDATKGPVKGQLEWPLPGCIRTRIKAAIDEAEKRKGSPPNTNEVFVAMENLYRDIRLPMAYLNAFMQGMLRENELYADPNCTVWTTHNFNGQHFKYSEYWQKQYGSRYYLNSKMQIRASQGTKTVSLKELKKMFLSKEVKELEKARWIFENEPKFLDGTPYKGDKVAFASFPRSGNTFLRKYFELLTGIQTGADNTPSIQVHLQCAGMKGEDTVDDSVWIIKTHSPWIMPFAPVFFASKAIVVVRNPLDVIQSWLELMTQASHSGKSPFKYCEEYPKFWDWWIKDCSERMQKWYHRVIYDARFKRVPTLFVRYEDLVCDPQPELQRIMAFLLNTSDLGGTNAERRIDEVIAKGREATQAYKLKDTTGRLNAYRTQYTDEQYQHVKETLREMICFCGYAGQTPGSFTKFFDYGTHTNEEIFW